MAVHQDKMYLFVRRKYSFLKQCLQKYEDYVFLFVYESLGYISFS